MGEQGCKGLLRKGNTERLLKLGEGKKYHEALGWPRRFTKSQKGVR